MRNDGGAGFIDVTHQEPQQQQYNLEDSAMHTTTAMQEYNTDGADVILQPQQLLYVYKTDMEATIQKMFAELSKKIDLAHQEIVALKTVVNLWGPGGTAATAAPQPEAVGPSFQFLKCTDKAELLDFENKLGNDTTFRGQVVKYLSSFVSAGTMAKQSHSAIMRLLPLLISNKVFTDISWTGDTKIKDAPKKISMKSLVNLHKLILDLTLVADPTASMQEVLDSLKKRLRNTTQLSKSQNARQPSQRSRKKGIYEVEAEDTGENPPDGDNANNSENDGDNDLDKSTNDES